MHLYYEFQMLRIKSNGCIDIVDDVADLNFTR